MKKLVVYHGDSPVQVEGFPKGCARTCKGALHIQPGKHKTVTDGEFEHIKKNYAWLLPKLKVVASIGAKEIEAEKERAAKVKAKAKPAPKGKEDKPASESKSQESPSEDGKKKRKKRN